MSNFWIDDLQDLTKLLTELNKRMGITSDGDYFIQESANVEIDAERKDSNWEILIIRAEKSAEKDGNSWRQRVIFEWNLNYQSIDEVIYDLKKLMGIK